MLVVVDGMRERIGCDTRASRQRTGFDTVVVERRVPLVLLLVRALLYSGCTKKRRHLRPARRAAPPGGHSARLRDGGREGREEGRREGREASGRGRGTRGQTKIDHATVPAQRDPGSRATLFVFVVHTMNAMSGLCSYRRHPLSCR